MRLHLIIFGVVVQVVQPLVRQTAYEECVGLAPRTFSRDLKEQLCGGVTVGNFPQSSAAVECANAVAKARALSPELTVELCAAGGNAAGKAGGECAAEAYKRLKMSNVPAALRMQLCGGMRQLFGWCASMEGATHCVYPRMNCLVELANQVYV